MMIRDITGIGLPTCDASVIDMTTKRTRLSSIIILLQSTCVRLGMDSLQQDNIIILRSYMGEGQGMTVPSVQTVFVVNVVRKIVVHAPML